MLRFTKLILPVMILLLSACGGGSNDNTASIHKSSIVTDVGAVRFLEQATFGANPESILRVKSLGFEAYLDEQIEMFESSYDIPTNETLYRTLPERFFTNSINGKDQLRQRMAYALNHIFVVSAAQTASEKDGIVSLQNYLLKNAFSNYFDILKGITLHPTMGIYLDMVNNVSGKHNENYAREVMQLFTIGLFKLNDDGTQALGFDGKSIPTYTQEDVENLARAFTGWTYPTKPGSTKKIYNPPYLYGQMEVSESLHDYSAKTILNNTYLPAGQTAEQDLNISLSTIFNHQNVAPFVSLRLIQHFVTSNPSPDYIQRVARIFNNNGSGVKGDIKAVIKAILLDDDARRVDYSLSVEPRDGKLKDPILFITNLFRSLEIVPNGILLYERAKMMGQTLFSPPSVFGDFPYDHMIDNSNLYGPEFKINSTSEIINRINFVKELVYDVNTHIHPLSNGAYFNKWISIAADTTKLIDKIDSTLLRGLMSSQMRQTLVDLIDSIDVNNPRLRAQTALYITLVSSQYNIQQ